MKVVHSVSIFFLDIIVLSSMEQNKLEYLSIMKEITSVKDDLDNVLILIRDQFREAEITSADTKEEVDSIKDQLETILSRLDVIERRLDVIENEI